MDTVVFVLILAALAAMRSRRRWPAVAAFLAALGAAVLLFRHHITDPLPLNF